MTYSCSDFTDDVLMALQDMGLLREADYCGDAPQSQGNAVKSALARMGALLEFAKGLQGTLPTDSDQALRSSLANLAGPQYLCSDHYGHCFVGSHESMTRWVLRLSDEELLTVQVQRAGVWKDLDDAPEVMDLLQDIRDNDVRRFPEDFDAVWSDALPSWCDRHVDAVDDSAGASVEGKAQATTEHSMDTLLVDMTSHEAIDWHAIHSGARQLTLTSGEIDSLLGSVDPNLNVFKRSLQDKLETGARARDIITMARRQRHEEGAIEIDDSAVISEGDDNGTYVSAWVWVDFGGTPMDKLPD